MSKKIYLTLIVAIAIISLVGCSKDNTVPETTTTTTQNTEITTNNAEQLSEIEQILQNLPNKDYGGTTIKVGGVNSLNEVNLPTTIQMSTDTETGEPVNDALYNRDLYIEDKYNVEIENIIAGNNGQIDNTALVNSLLADDHIYDYIYGDAALTGAALINNKLIYPTNDVPNIQLENWYWIPDAQKALTVSDKMYFLTGSITPRYYGSLYIYIFNKTMMSNYKLENIYDLVSGGKWTIDKMYEMASAVTADINGDGVMDTNDQYGVGYEMLTPDTLFFGSGKNMTVSKNGELEFTFEDETITDIMDKVKNFINSDYTLRDGTDDADVYELFGNGQLLFNDPCVFNLAGFRDKEVDFGIIPVPKYDEKQSDYYAYGQPWASSYVYVPYNVADVDMVGMLIEAMGAYGEYKVKPAVFDNVVLTKSIRDEESAKIINLIFQNVKYDLLTIFNWADLHTMYLNVVFDKTSEMASSYAKIKDKAYAEVRANPFF